MKETTTIAQARFSMVKQWHKKTFQKALQLKKADPQIIAMCRFFANTKDFFTSSTCSGRIVLLKVNKNESKQDSVFLEKWHKKAPLEKIWKTLAEKNEPEIWFKQEPFILHIGAGNIEKAAELLAVAKGCGIKRAGINSAKEGKVILEIIGTQSIAFPLKKEKTILMQKENFGYILKRANQKLEKNYKQLLEFERACRKKFG